MNILSIYEMNIPTVAIMRNASQRQKDPQGHVNHFKQLNEVTREDIDWCDILEMIRPNDPYSVFLAKRAREAGCFIMSMYDDDLYALPKSMPNPYWRVSSVRKALGLSHILTTCSPHIREKYQDFTADKRAHCSDSVVEASEIKMIPELTEDPGPEQKVKLVYAANASHVGFFNHFILPIMPKLCQRYAGRISMTFMGVKPELSRFAKQVEISYLNSMPLAEYRQTIQDGDFDIGLSPLTADNFTRCKYFNKFIEYSMAGIVGMYSNTEPYTYVVKHNENGFLVNDDPEDWYKALCTAIDNAFLRNRCVRNAQQLLLDTFNAEVQMERCKDAIPELTSWDAERKPCRSLQPQRTLNRLVPVADNLYKVFFYLKRTGILGLIRQVKTHFREKGALSR